MPSFHAGWNLLLGIVIFRATRTPLLRAFAVLMPAAMAFAVVATANHYVIDVIVGAAIVLAALGLLDVVDRQRGRHERLRVALRSSSRPSAERPAYRGSRVARSLAWQRADRARDRILCRSGRPRDRQVDSSACSRPP
jgi:membrane-associated phospholipid phosphatase